MTQPRPRRKAFARQGRGPESKGETGPLANHAQSPRLRPTYKALLEPQEAA